MKKIMWYSLFSTLLLLLSFKVFGVWFFSFIALVPWLSVLNSTEAISQKKIFASGFVFGGVFSFCLIFLVLFNNFLIWFPAVLIYGTCFGLLGIAYRKLKRNGMIDIFLFAALWVALEWLRQIIFQNFDYTTIAYTAYGLTPLLSLASIGGIYLVSFIIVIINGFIGYFRSNGFSKKSLKIFGIFIAAIVSVYFLNQWYLNSGNAAGHDISFSSIQLKENIHVFASMQNGKLVLDPQLKALIQQAVNNKTDYIVYPNDLTQYIIADQASSSRKYISATFDQVNDLLSSIVPADTKFIFWSDAARGGNSNAVFDEADFWQNGTIAGYYDKRTLHPFHALLSNYFMQFGVISKPYYADYVASKENKTVDMNDARFGNLSCSELNYSYLARRDAGRGANIIFSLGYASVFEYPVLGELDEPIAQMRAVETNVPLVRSDIRGPSILVDRKGNIVSEMGANQYNVLEGKLFIEDHPRRTLYTYWGDYPFIIILFLFIISFYLMNCKRNGV